jgi:tetratricopeptide (TPR) repeat protein
MHHHPLVFTRKEAALLRKEYETLLHKIEQGKKLHPEYLADLTDTMRTLLYEQKGMEVFWQTVQAQPQDSYHLHLTHKDKALLNLPWQMAIDRDAHPLLYVSKGAPVSKQLRIYEPKAGPLQILVMISSPINEDMDRRLSYEEEEEAILKAVAPLWKKGLVQVSYTADGSLHSLEKQLAQQYYHIVYLSGHGVYKYDTGYLQLENKKTFKGELVSAVQLAKTVTKRKGSIPALVILASCQTAQGTPEEGFRGVADELMAQGVPAVIAMAFSITDRYATVFAGQLYQQLAQQEKLLTAYGKALQATEAAEAAQATAEGYYYGPTQWLIPQLYYNQQIQDIVDWQAKEDQCTGTQTGEQVQQLLLTQRPNFRFIGRRQESAHLLSSLQGHEPVLIRGQGGIGKTALAEQLVQRLRAYDRSYHAFAFNMQRTTLAVMIKTLEDYLQQQGIVQKKKTAKSPANKAEQQLVQLVHTVSTHCKPVWLFDQLDSCQQSIGGALQPAWKDWLSFTRKHLLSHYPVIFTSRYPVPELTGLAGIVLNQVSLPDFYRQCQQLSIRDISKKYPGSTGMVTAECLYNIMGGNYRALEHFEQIYLADVAKTSLRLEKIRLEEDSEKAYQQRYTITKQVQALLDKDGKQPLFTHLLDLLTDLERSTFVLLGNFRLPVLPQALERQKAKQHWLPALERLKDLTLIEEHSADNGQQHRKGNYYFVTTLIREWQEHALLTPGPLFTHEKAGDYCYYMSLKVTRRHSDSTEAFRHFMLAQHAEKVNKVGAMLSTEYYRISQYEEAMHYAMETYRVAREHTDLDVLNNLGLLYRMYGQPKKAMEFLGKFYLAAKAKGDPEKEGYALNNISNALKQQGANGDAIKLLEESIRIARKLGDKKNEGARLNSLAQILDEQGNYLLAKKLYQQSLRIRRAMGNRYGEAMTTLNLAHGYFREGKHKKALESLRFCLQVFREQGDQQAVGNALHTIGSMYSDLGDYDKALDYLYKGLALQRSIRHKAGEADTLNNIGLLHAELADTAEAISCLQKCVALYQSMDYKHRQAAAGNNLSGLYRTTGQYELALATAEKSLQLYLEDEDLKGQSESYFHLAMTYQEMNNAKKSKACFKKSKALLEQLGEGGSAELLNNIDQLLLSPKNKDQGLLLLMKNLERYRAVGNRSEEAGTLYEMSLLAMEMNEHDHFFEWAMESYLIYTELQHQHGIFLSGRHVGFMLYAQPDPEERAQGLEILQHCYQIGMKAGYPGASQIADFIRQVDGMRK